MAVLVQLKPALFYAGIVCTILALLINYKVLGWLVGWVLIYFIVIDLSSTLGARFARELCVVFGILVGIIFAHLLFVFIAGRWRQLSLNSISLDKNYIGSARLVIGVAITGTIILLSYWYFLDYFQGASNPKTVKYYTDEMGISNKYFLTAVENKNASSGADEKRTIALFGDNPWLKVMTYGHYDVLGIQPMNTGFLAKKGSSVNDELHQLLSDHDEGSISCIIKKYDVNYLYVSDKISGRWYNPAKSDDYYRELSNFPSGHQSDLFDLDAEFIGKDGEHLRIFSIKSANVDRLCG